MSKTMKRDRREVELDREAAPSRSRDCARALERLALHGRGTARPQQRAGSEEHAGDDHRERQGHEDRDVRDRHSYRLGGARYLKDMVGDVSRRRVRARRACWSPPRRAGSLLQSMPAPLPHDAFARAVRAAFGAAARVAGAEPLAGDASTRRYVRLRLADDGAPPTAVAMLLPPDAHVSPEVGGAEPRGSCRSSTPRYPGRADSLSRPCTTTLPRARTRCLSWRTLTRRLRRQSVARRRGPALRRPPTWSRSRTRRPRPDRWARLRPPVDPRARSRGAETSSSTASRARGTRRWRAKRLAGRSKPVCEPPETSDVLAPRLHGLNLHVQDGRPA
jgi:hypothetical protein